MSVCYSDDLKMVKACMVDDKSIPPPAVELNVAKSSVST